MTKAAAAARMAGRGCGALDSVVAGVAVLSEVEACVAGAGSTRPMAGRDQSSGLESCFWAGVEELHSEMADGIALNLSTMHMATV